MNENKMSKAEIREVVKEVFNIVENEEREKEKAEYRRKIREHLKELQDIAWRERFYTVMFGVVVGVVATLLFCTFLSGGGQW